MQNNSLFTREHKHQLALFGILVLSSIISIGLFAARAAPSPRGPYSSLVLNLFLAWIPFLLAWFVYKFFYHPIKIVRVLLSFCAILWLIFFPNSLYILTDFQHIAIRDTDTPVWYDVIMLLWFSWSGLFLGVVSLYLMQKFVTRWSGRVFGWLFVVIAIILGSLGVYIGRFISFNSWDVILNPLSMFGMLREHILHVPNQEIVIFSFLFALFLLCVYVMLFIFGQLINKQGNH
jgi:uncharacterized membrane protein